jgi:hypothetical protein
MTQYIEVDITSDMCERAEAKAAQLGALKNSILEGNGNLSGYLGEEAAISTYPNAEHVDSYDYDITIAGRTFDVKTKKRTVPPQSSYECSVAAVNTHQNADFYLFVSLWNYVKAYIVGFMPKCEYIERARFLHKGEIDGSNHFKVRDDCFNMFFYELYAPKQLFSV